MVDFKEGKHVFWCLFSVITVENKCDGGGFSENSEVRQEVLQQSQGKRLMAWAVWENSEEIQDRGCILAVKLPGLAVGFHLGEYRKGGNQEDLYVFGLRN